MNVIKSKLFKLGLFAAILIAAAGGLSFKPRTAICAYCPAYPCYGSCMGTGCICVTPPGQYSGMCYGAGMKEFFEAKGYDVK